MWTIVYHNKENGKRMWEMGFGKYILRRLAFLSENWRVYEIGYIHEEELCWNNFVACLFRYGGVFDEESIEAEGEVR